MLDPAALDAAASDVAQLVERAKAIADAADKRHPIPATVILPLLAAAYLRALEAAHPFAPVDGMEPAEEVELEPPVKAKRGRKG